MVNLNKLKKAQSLPLNTIVIAMLVIIVLLVIIVFFTNSVSKSGDTLNQNDASSCSINNPALKTLRYTDAKTKDDYNKLSEDEKAKYSLAVGIADCYVKK